jgi:signal transduction histidine kinase
MAELSQYPPVTWIYRRWAELTLARQFALTGAVVLVAGMAVMGFWVTRQIEEGVTRNTATATALYIDSVIAPLLPDLRKEETLSEGARRALDETLSQGPLGQRLASFKIWKDGGLITYSSRPELIGRRFEPSENLALAWEGEVAAEFDRLNDDEDALERAEGVPLLEVYSPIREPWTGKVVAVAEFYEINPELRSNLRAARVRSWLVVALVAAGIMALLSGIVLRGSRTIVGQSRSLEARVAELSRLVAQNRELRLRVERASSRAVALNERFLKRISADLHDGPAQLLALAALKLGDAKVPSETADDRRAELEPIRRHLDEALREIREICRGLTLPQIERLDLERLLQTVVETHEHRTGTKVTLQSPEEAPAMSISERICIFRFVQEGLNNAFRHAGGLNQVVAASVSGRWLEVSVSDQGRGFDPGNYSGVGLGLAGLRERIESLGGEFGMESSPHGTRLTMVLKLAE